ncbi:MAG: polysaccharide deacetylase family protein [Mariniphaga sp.]|nr:polysaccharide deacetylase family protein [Mariniphaga sp.]
MSGEQFIFPLYHLVSNNPPAHVKNLYNVTPVKHFLNDLDFLLQNFQPASINDVINYIKEGKKSTKPFFFLSFDDGMRECYEVVYPILKQKGLEAAFFINPAFVDNKNLFYRSKISLIIDQIQKNGKIFELSDFLKIYPISTAKVIDKISTLKYSDIDIIEKAGKKIGIDFNEYLDTYKPYMTLLQIKELQENGFLIGSHSYDHPKFWEISELEMREQIKSSFDFIDNIIQLKVRSFAFPFSDIETPISFFNFLTEEIKLDVSFGTAGIKIDTEPVHIQRIPMDVELKSAERIIKKEYGYFVFKFLFGKNLINRK